MRNTLFSFFFLITFCIESCGSKYHKPIEKVDTTGKHESKRIIDSSLYRQSKGDQSTGSSPIQPPPPTWVYTDQKDQSSSRIIHSATINAKEPIQFRPPYNGGSVATLEIRKMRGQTNVILEISNGQFNSNYYGQFVDVSFDGGRSVTYPCMRSTDSDPRYLFINFESGFITKLKRTHTLCIQTTFYNDEIRDIQFEVGGFRW
jgi:hypothetical protein